MYFSGQGKISIAALDASTGLPGAFRWLGNIPDFTPKFETSKTEHKESWSGQRLTDKALATENKASFSGTLEDWSKENLALVTKSALAAIEAGAVTNEVAPTGLVAGDVWALKNPGITSLVITDSTGSPLTLSLTTDYTADLDYGTVTIVDPSGFVQPFKAAYTKTALDVVPFFTEGTKEVALRFEGINTADENKKVLVELYRISIDPTEELPLITEEFGQFTVNGNCLIDATKGEDELFGKFGRMIYID
jgi:hypothetical protein